MDKFFLGFVAHSLTHALFEIYVLFSAGFWTTSTYFRALRARNLTCLHQIYILLRSMHL
jgi:hypothetical protein